MEDHRALFDIRIIDPSGSGSRANEVLEKLAEVKRAATDVGGRIVPQRMKPETATRFWERQVTIGVPIEDANRFKLAVERIGGGPRRIDVGPKMEEIGFGLPAIPVGREYVDEDATVTSSGTGRGFSMRVMLNALNANAPSRT